MPCQDESAAVVEEICKGRELLALFVSDGAGSAVSGQTGAELAVEASLKLIGVRVLGDVRLDEPFARDLVAAVRDAISERAERTGVSVSDYACTFVALLSEPNLGTLVIQIGDGGVVLDMGTGLQCMVEPMNGEYANTTRFVTDHDALDLVEVRHLRGYPLRAALFTDGLQNVSLDQLTNVPHERFFQPFFSALLNAPIPNDATAHPLEPALCRFLQSEHLNKRTDDDKSLALAVWVPLTDSASET